MCQSCPHIATLEELRKLRRPQIDAIVEALVETEVIEDFYRMIGMAYHRSELRARRDASQYLSQNRLNRFKEFFEISRVEEYHGMFKNLDETIEGLTNLYDLHYRHRGTLQELVHQYYNDLNPEYCLLHAKFGYFYDDLETCRLDVQKLLDASVQAQQTNSDGKPTWWHYPVSVNRLGEPVIFRMEDEWEVYKAWLGSLPEIQRAIESGRTLDKIALDLLDTPLQTYGLPVTSILMENSRMLRD